MSYTAGTVSARIELDTSDFDKKVKELQSKVDALKVQLQNNGLMDVNKQLKEVQGQLKESTDKIKDLETKCKDYKKQLNNLRDGNKSLADDIKKTNNELNKNQTNLDNVKKSVDNTVKSHKENAKALQTENKAIKDNVKTVTQEVKSNEKLNQSLKKTEAQAKKTSTQYRKMGTELNKSFTKDLFTSLKKADNGLGSVWLQPIYDELKQKYKPLVKNKLEFDRLWQDAIPRIGSKLTPTRDPDKFVKMYTSPFSKETHNFGRIVTDGLKSVKEIKESFREVAQEESKATVEATKLNNQLKKLRMGNVGVNNRGTLSDRVTNFKEIQQHINSTKQVANEEKKTSEVIADATKKNIQNKTKEANTFKKHTEYELKLLENFNSKFKHWNTSKNGNLIPLDHFKNLGGRKSEYFRNYSSILNSNKKDNKLSGWDYSGDYTEFFQKRVKGLLKELNVTVSDVTDKEFKKVKDKTTGKLVEYLDVSNFKEGSKWIENERKQIRDYQRAKSSLEKQFSGLGSTKYSRERFKGDVDFYSKQFYDRYGKQGNPYFKDYLKNTKAGKAITDRYKQAQKDLDNYHYYPSEIKKASQAMNTFDRGLKTTAIDWNKLNNSAKQFKQYSNNWELTADQIKRANTALFQFDRMNKGLLGRHKLETGLPTKEVDYERLLNKASVKLDTLPKLEQAGFEAGKKILQEYLNVWSEAPIVVNRSVNEINSAMSKFVDLNKRGGYKPLGWDKFKQYSNNWELTAQQMEKGTKGFTTLERRLKSTEISVAGFSKIYSELGTAMGSGNHYIQNTLNSFRNLGNGVDIQKAKLKAFADQTKATFETMQVELAKANAATYKYWKQVRGTADVKGYNQLGTLDIGINQYYGQIDKINAKLAEFKVQQQSVNNNINQTYSAFEKASQGVALLTSKMQQYESVVNQRTQGFTKTQTQLSQLESRLSHFSGLSEKNSAALGKFGERITILKDKLNVLNKAFRQGQLSENQYDNATNKLSRDVAKLDKEMQMMIRELSLGNIALDKHGNVVNKNSAEYKKLEANARQTGRGLTSFNNGVTQTAHSGRILSNTLYQIRGALLSLKMIFTAMGGMALWGFATQIAEGVKTTLQSKNEMEAQLKQNKKVGDGGVATFRKELDKLTKTYKKVNKYSIGETVSSIGLEFDLTTEQMKDALPIVTMIQSEYVRAGRKSEEAALAVKDILQGEFQRLSRETGVGKDELVAYGWDEDKTNIDGLLKALKKAALDRHWDIFAKKATSLNDVLTITQSRFEETGADLLDSASPMIVEAFNLIIGAIDNVSTSFNSLNSFWRSFLWIGGGGALFGGILTALPMVTKGMGLADIATIGWSKSIATAALNLNKAEVAQYGFRRALAAVISGTKASEVANTRWTKSIMGRLLGVNQTVLAEKGYGKALLHNKALLKEGIDIERISFLERDKTGKLTGKLSKLELTRSQRLAYLTNNIKLSEAAEMGRGRAILKTATSWKVLGLAIRGVMAIGIVAWLSSLAVQADLVKKRVEAFNEIVETGSDKLKEAKEESASYQKIMDKYANATSKEDKNKYAQAKANKAIVDGNVKELETANKLAKSYKAQNDEREKSIKLAQSSFRKSNLMAAGHSETEATEKQAFWVDKINQAQYEITNSYNKQYDWLEASSKHINENLKHMQETKRTQKDMDKYIMEYSTVAEEAGEHLKQFYQGDLMAGAYFAIDNLKLLWIDIWNNDAFLNFWQGVLKTWDDLKPTAYAIKDALVGIGEALLNFFGTDAGRWTFAIGALGTGLGLISLKIGKWVSGSDSVFEVLKKVGGKLKDVAKGWKDVKDNAEDAIEKTGGTTTSTGGINGDVDKTKAKTPFKETLKSDAQNYARAAIGIAAGMLLITEAIILLKAPMWGLAEVGKQFKAQEPEIQAGIEGLKLISPVLAVLLPAVVGLSLIMDKYAPSYTQIVTGTLKAAIGIAAGMLLVAETIVMIIPSIWAIGALGDQYSGIQAQVQKGTQAMKIVSDSLNYLAPFIPALALAIGTIALAFANPMIGAIIGTAVTLGIPIGMLWVAETIWSLEYPLNQIAALGSKFTNLEGVRQGAEAIKLTAEALGYVEQAMRSFALIAWDSLATAVAQLIGVKIGVDLTQLTGEGGFFSQLETFTSDFNKLEITQIDSAKVTTLSESATGIDSVKTALVTVKDALKDLPNFETDTRSPNEKYQDAVSGAATADTTGVTNYFEQLKQPIDQLNEFVKNFNENITVEPINPDKVAALQNSANGITAIQTAIDAVKNAMGSAVDASWQGNMASGGILGAAVGYLIGDGNPQASGLKSGLDELYMSVKDIMDFNTKINGLTTTQSGDTSNVANASNMVSALQTEINNLKTTLSGAIPTVKATAKDMGKSIVSGVKEGLTSLNSDVSSALTGLSDTMSSKGKGLGEKLSNGFKDNAKIKSTAETEVGYALQYLEERKQDFYDKGAALGTALSNGFKDNNGLDQHSPGKMARAVSDEMGYIGQALTNTGGLNLPQMASQLAQSLTTNFNPSFGLGNIQLPNLDQFKQSISTVAPIVTGMKTKVTTDFTAMKTGIQTSFTNIVSRTRTSLSNMKAATIGNIGNIKTSWKGMQDALIASADHIKTQTGQKISKLKSNLGEFWNKIKHPDQLIGSQGGHTGSIRRRFTGGRANGHYAGGTVSRSQSLFKGKRSSGQPSDNSMLDYLKCMMYTGKPCYAGGWNFNWTNKISKKFKGWNTHFGAYHLDDFLNVGKFENSNFPVKGRADVAKQYIFDVIRATDYDKYFDSNFGDDPVAALRAGAFNCWDGTNIVLAIARAFGFEGSRGHGTWNGIGHVWANIPGLGIIDPTAIQNRGTFKSSAVKGYSAGSMPRRYASKNTDVPANGVVNNTTEVHIHGNVYGVDDLEKAIDDGVKKANRRLYGRRLSGV